MRRCGSSASEARPVEAAGPMRVRTVCIHDIDRNTLVGVERTPIGSRRHTDHRMITI